MNTLKSLINMSKQDNMFDVAFLLAEKNNINLLKELSNGYDLTKNQLKELFNKEFKDDILYYDLCINLLDLDCSMGDIKQLDFFNNRSLTDLDYSNNYIETLNLKNNKKLYSLNCYSNTITKLDIKHNTLLTFLNCSDNKIKNLNIKNNVKLQTLLCSDNPISKLDISNNLDLVTLNIFNTKIKTLDISNNHNLSYLRCNVDELILTKEQRLIVDIKGTVKKLKLV